MANTFNNTDWSDDIFDVVNVDDDIDDDKNEVERMIMEDYYEDLNFDSDQEQEEEEEQPIITEEFNNIKNNDQEQILSQKLSQLSTEGQKRPLSTPTSSQEEHSKKKICLPIEFDEQKPQKQQETNQITSYVETMDEMFHRTMSNTNGISPDKLQLFIDCKHKIGRVQLHLKRWIRYSEANVQQQIWSKEIIKLFTMKKIDENQYESYVEKYMNEMNRTLEELQEQYNTYKNNCPELTDIIENKLDEFVQHYRLIPFTMKSDYELALFEYEYQDQLLQREFLHMKPTDKQVSSLFLFV